MLAELFLDVLVDRPFPSIEGVLIVATAIGACSVGVLPMSAVGNCPLVAELSPEPV